MRAVLRYRRIPFRWIMRGSAADVGIPSVPVALIPVIVVPGENGAPDEPMIDSTFQIRRLETIFSERSVVPPDLALAFLQELIEEYADEWLTKPMFHFRWKYGADTHKASQVLALDRDPHLSPERLAQASRLFADRQVSRLGVVGSNDVTASVIEDSYRRLLGLLDAHVQSGNMFLMGKRPGVGDFGLFGQLSQLVHFDPTPAAIAATETPRVVSWVSHVDDLSGLEIDGAGWSSRSALPSTLRGFFNEIGRVYAPFLIANARALQNGASQVECEIGGRRWVQQPFPYQRKCLKWLRERHAALAKPDRDFVDSRLSSTGADTIFSTKI
jgi:hypothetical protein